MACEVFEVNVALCKQDLYIIHYMFTFEEEMSTNEPYATNDISSVVWKLCK